MCWSRGTKGLIFYFFVVTNLNPKEINFNFNTMILQAIVQGQYRFFLNHRPQTDIHSPQGIYSVAALQIQCRPFPKAALTSTEPSTLIEKQMENRGEEQYWFVYYFTPGQVILGTDSPSGLGHPCKGEAMDKITPPYFNFLKIRW